MSGFIVSNRRSLALGNRSTTGERFCHCPGARGRGRVRCIGRYHLLETTGTTQDPAAAAHPLVVDGDTTTATLQFYGTLEGTFPENAHSGITNVFGPASVDELDETTAAHPPLTIYEMFELMADGAPIQIMLYQPQPDPDGEGAILLTWSTTSMSGQGETCRLAKQPVLLEWSADGRKWSSIGGVPTWGNTECRRGSDIREGYHRHGQAGGRRGIPSGLKAATPGFVSETKGVLRFSTMASRLWHWREKKATTS